MTAHSTLAARTTMGSGANRFVPAGRRGLQARFCRFSRARRVAAAAALAALAAATLLASQAEAKAPPSFFGISPQTELTDADYAAMYKNNFRTLRVSIPWSVVDPAAPAGGYDWSSSDKIIAGAASHGIQVQPVLYATPEWVAQGLDGYSCDAASCFLYGPKSAAAQAAWAEFVAAAVARYGPNGEFWQQGTPAPSPGGTIPCLLPVLCKQGATAPSHSKATAAASRSQVCDCGAGNPIRVWQIWNEQNSGSFYLPGPDPRTYASIVATAAAAARSVDPNADVILGGMAELKKVPNVMPAHTFLRKLYKVKGFKASFDGVASHPYGNTLKGVTKQVDLLRAEMVRAKDKKTGMYVTEVGWSSEEGGNWLNLGSTGQAAMIRKAYKYFTTNRKALRLQNVSYFTWADSNSTTVCEWCGQAGLLDAALQPKPALEVLTRFSGAG